MKKVKITVLKTMLNEDLAKDMASADSKPSSTIHLWRDDRGRTETYQ